MRSPLRFQCILLLIPIIVFSKHGYSQKSDSTKNKGNGAIAFSGGISYQDLPIGQSVLMCEAGIMYDPNPVGGLMGPRATTDLGLTNTNHFFIGPKLSYELNLILLGVRLSLTDYTDFTSHDFRFTPEIGITILGAFDLLFGYNIPLGNERLQGVGTTQITLTINFSHYAWYEMPRPF